MSSVPPARFYTGLVSELYAPLRGNAPDPEPYARFVQRGGGTALELGCGDGDPLLELRRRGLEVEGLDASPDMLERCRRRAAAEGLDVTLHEATFEGMALGRRYRSIYLAGPSFNLLVDDEAAGAALTRIAAHLEPGGAALVPLFVPPPVPREEIGAPRRHERTDGAVLQVTTVAATRDEEARTQTCTLRYEVLGPDPKVLERPWVLHWHEQRSFAGLVRAAGLQVRAVVDRAGRPADPDDGDVTFLLAR